LVDLRPALVNEYRAGLRLHGGHDFVEGVRAQVVDKDRNPRWSPSALAEVGNVDYYFDALAQGDLEFTPAI
jgi:enoyl-CoA hydratase